MLHTVEKEVEKEVRRCAGIILKAERGAGMADTKEGRANLVTAYDRQVQKELQKSLTRILPEAVFVGEEEDIHASIASGYAWIVDPIDGTTNFIKDYHVSAISVGLTRDGIPCMGLIYNPYLDEMFYAISGEGAFCNGRPIHVSSSPLEEGIVLFGTSPYYPELTDRSFALARQLFAQSLDIRRSGSAALDLCSIAAGRAELYFELRLSPWDYAAGSIIVEEAGGKITRLDGSPVTYSQPCEILATNGIAEMIPRGTF